MHRLCLISVLAPLFTTMLAAVEPVHPALPFDLATLKLVDEIDLGSAEPGHEFQELPAGATTTVDILGRSARVLTNAPGSEGKYLAVRVGAGKGLEAKRGYILVIDYPEDVPRAITVFNLGSETKRGFHTGTAVGDGLRIPYVHPNSESIDYPLAGAWRNWIQYFHLHDRTPNIKTPEKAADPRPNTPADGFWVIIAHLSHANDPLSHGAALGHIRLYEAPAFDTITAPLVLPPADLPQRHLFYREEMADGVHGDAEQNKRGVDDPLDWYVYHARLMRFLGMDTFSKDLLEFGHNQGWDSAKYGGNAWINQNRTPDLWSRIVPMATEHGLNLLPMYEYCGSVGQTEKSHGRKRRAETLHQRGKGPKGSDDYTHIWWSEKANADVTDPDTIEDLRRILEVTIADEATKGRFIGAWLRPRNSGLPISFSDRCRDEYATARKLNAAPTRAALIADTALYQDYLDWWFEQRKVFANAIRDHLRSPAFGIGKDAVLLFTHDVAEAGKGLAGGGVVSDDPARFAGIDIKVRPFDQIVQDQAHLNTLLALNGTWDGWEWQHSVPPPDPDRYRDNPGVLNTYTFHKLHTVSDDSMTRFATPDGLAMIRHYCLNENAFTIGEDKRPIGYFVTDMEVAGPYIVLPEARALANGDPRFIGYLASNCFNRGFPAYVRAFNQAFLALPAIPSTRLADAASVPDVVVREYPSTEHGTWYAIINTSLHDARAVKLTLPGTAALTDRISGTAIDRQAPVSLYPGQVLVWYAAP